MVSFTTLTLAVVAAAVTGAQAQRAPFSKPCNAPYDVCGWTLANGEFSKFPSCSHHSPQQGVVCSMKSILTFSPHQTMTPRSSRTPPRLPARTPTSAPSCTTRSTTARPTASSRGTATATMAATPPRRSPTPTAGLKCLASVFHRGWIVRGERRKRQRHVLQAR